MGYKWAVPNPLDPARRHLLGALEADLIGPYDPSGDDVCRATFDYNLTVDVFANRTWEELVSFLKDTNRDASPNARSQFLFDDWAVVEFKFLNSLPLRLKQWVEDYQMVPMSFSKYRTAMVVGFDG